MTDIIYDRSEAENLESLEKIEAVSAEDWQDDPDLADPDDPSDDSVIETGWGLETQKLLAAHVCYDAETLAAAEQCLTPRVFCTKYHRVAVEIALEHYRQHGTPPSKLWLEARYADHANAKWKPVEVPVAIAHVQELHCYPLMSREALIDLMRTQSRKYLIGKAYIDYSGGKLDSAKFFEAVEAARAATGGSGDSDYDLYSADDILEQPDLIWQIEHHIPQSGTVVVFGPSGSAKSFYLLEMAFAVASGRPFLGLHEVQAGRVLYIYSEGRHGLKGRIRSLLADCGQPSNILFSTRSHDLTDRSAVRKLLDKAEAKLGQIDLVIVDTLSRNFGAGDTDNNKDMQAYLRGVDYIREATEGTVITVHHTGWSNEERERGAKSLRDYADTSIGISKKDMRITATCRKQKDAEEFEPYELDLVSDPANRSARLVYLGTTSQIQAASKAESASETERSTIARILDVIPEVSDPAERETVTQAEISEMAKLSYGTVAGTLKTLMSDGQVKRDKFGGDHRSPYRYWRELSVTTSDWDKF